MKEGAQGTLDLSMWVGPDKKTPSLAKYQIVASAAARDVRLCIGCTTTRPKAL